MRKRSSIIMFGILTLAFALTSVKAVGTIPTTYNQSAQEILSMLWGKLDEAIVGNYNVGMLVRYHDHAGTNPGDFTTRGLPVSSSGIANDAITGAKIEANAVGSSEIADNAVDSGAVSSGAVTATKLSTAARTHVVAVQVGSIPAGTGEEKPIFIAPGSGTVTAVSFTNSTAITIDPTNYTYLGIWKWVAGDNLIIKYFQTNSTSMGANFAPNRYTSLQNTSFTVGTPFTFYKYEYGAGQAINDMLVTIEYTVSE